MSTPVSIREAERLVELRRWPEALEALSPELADPAAGAYPWCLLAQCRLGLGDARGARTAAERAIAVQPDEEAPHRLAAIAALYEGRRMPARTHALRAVELAPHELYPLSVLATVRLALGDVTGAGETADRMRAEHPSASLSWEAVASVALARRRWSDAEHAARTGLQISPHDADLMLQLGQALDGQKRPSEAGEAFASAARADPTDQRARRALGRVGLRTVVPVVVVGGLAVAKGLVVLKAVWLSVLGLRMVHDHDYAVLALVGISTATAVAFAVQESRHRRARRELPPALAAVAARERRRDRRSWLWTVLVLAAVALVVGVTGRDAVAVALVVGAAAAAAAAVVELRATRDRTAVPRPRRRFAELLPQSMRRRLR